MKRISSPRITELKTNEIFVFGSNSEGQHHGGAARLACQWGAVWGQGFGLAGQTYAIPTMSGYIDEIDSFVYEFVVFARSHPELKFLVTEIGCGIAGYTPEQIAPFFKRAIDMENIYLPQSFYDIIVKQ